MRILSDKLATAVLAAIGLVSVAAIAGSAAAIGRAAHMLSEPVASVLEVFAGIILAPLGLIMLLADSTSEVDRKN
jgi:sulfite exporter TauE/SafE